MASHSHIPSLERLLLERVLRKAPKILLNQIALRVPRLGNPFPRNNFEALSITNPSGRSKQYKKYYSSGRGRIIP
eukprot:scaffold1549_cov156-Amphora_coffeaeformis.AAC.1